MTPFFAGSVLQAFYIPAIDEGARSYKTKNISASRYIAERHLLTHLSKCVRISRIATDGQ